MASSCDNQVSIGVLLAGGSARRAGVDTRFLVLGGRALLLRNLAFLRGFFPTVAVSLGAGQMLDLGDAHHAEVVHDAWCASPRSSIWPAPSETATVGKKPRRKARLRKSNARPPSTRKRVSTPARRALPPARSTPILTWLSQEEAITSVTVYPSEQAQSPPPRPGVANEQTEGPGLEA